MLPAKSCCSSVCAQCVSDEQIRELMNVDRSNGAVWVTCEVALGCGPETTERSKANARRLCADLYNSYGLVSDDAEAAADYAREQDEREAAKHETEDDRLGLRSMWSVQ